MPDLPIILASGRSGAIPPADCCRKSVRMKHRPKADWVAAVLVLSRSKGTARLVMLAIAHSAAENGASRASLTELSSWTLIKKRWLIEIISGLIALGELRKSAGGGRGNPNLYHITLPLKGALFSTLSETIKGAVVITFPIHVP